MGLQKLLKQLFLFVAIIALGYFALAQCSYYKTAFEIKKKPVILLGDSQTEFLHNTTLLNNSIHGCPFFVQFKYVNQFKESFRNKTVLIAFNNHHLSSLYQNRMYDESLYPGWRNEMIHNYFTFDLINLWDLDFEKPKDYSLEIFDFTKVKKWIRSLAGGNEKVRNSSIEVTSYDQIKGYVYRHWEDKRYKQPDHIQLYYFNALVQLLESLECKIYALKMPLTKEYKERIPEAFIEKYKSVLAFYPSVTLLDMDSVMSQKLNWTHFKDYGHLNLKGDAQIQLEFDKFMGEVVE